MGFTSTSNLLASAQLSGGGGLEVLWEWNGSDITQFGNGSGTPDYTYGTPDGTLSVGAVPGSGADVPSGNVLIYTTGTATSSTAYFLINDLPALPERFIYRARVGPVVGGVTCEACMVFAAQDATHWIGTAYNGSGILQAQLGNNRNGLYTDGQYMAMSGASSLASGTVIIADCMLRDPDTGVDPQINVIIKEARSTILAFGKGGYSWSPFGTPPAIYDSSWQSGGSIKNPGVAFLCNGSALQAWIGEMQILTHPWEG